MCFAKLLIKFGIKVFHSFKLKSYGIEGEKPSLLQCYFGDRKERIGLHGQTSDWRKINRGITQGSVLGALLFLIYINDLADRIISICKIFVDNTSLL